MRKLALLFALMLVSAPAWALNISDLLSTIAMPLAVAAISNTTGVQNDRLTNLVTALNQANVPPTQFVEVVRYVPVALVQTNPRTDFVQFVQNEVSQGITGNALVNDIVNQLSTNFGVTPQLTLPAPATTIVVQDNFIPTDVLSQIGLTPNDLLASAMMPVAVDTVSVIPGVSQDALGNLVATLDQANVPPTQVIEIIRFAPPALVVNNGQPFVQFVQQQASQFTGPALVPVVVQQLQTFFPPQTQIAVAPAQVSQPVIVDEEHFVPPMVISRAAQMAGGNPFGGPPGQIKKELGDQTGAEVVHGGVKPGRQFTPAPIAVAPMPMEHDRGHAFGRMRHEERPAPMMSSTPAPAPVPVPTVVPAERGRGRGHGREMAAPMAPVPPPPVAAPAVVQPPAARGVPPGHAKENGNGGGKGHGHGKD